MKADAAIRQAQVSRPLECLECLECLESLDSFGPLEFPEFIEFIEFIALSPSSGYVDVSSVHRRGSGSCGGAP